MTNVMRLLLLLLLVILLLKFPPGTIIEWNLGTTRVIWPIGWCLAVSLTLCLLMSILRKS